MNRRFLRRALPTFLLMGYALSTHGESEPELKVAMIYNIARFVQMTTDHSSALGDMLQLVAVEGRPHFRINQHLAEKSGLALNAKLLQLALPGAD